MEDGGESRVIKNMKMNKIWDAVLGSSQQLQSFSLASYLNFAQLKASIKEEKTIFVIIFLLHFSVD